jgi:phage-related protein
MKGVLFGEYHTWGDFQLVMNEKEISAPEPKTHYVEVEGADGSLDFSEAFGEVKFKRRKLKYVFTSLVPRKSFWTEFTRIQNILHGKEFKIIDDEDPEYYYIGRVTIDKWKIDKVVGSFEVDIEAKPYKYRINETIRTEYVTGTQWFGIWNDRMSVNPTFRVSSPMDITFGGKTISIGTIDTDFTSTDIVFTEGNNTLEVTGEGLLTIRYQEGAL